MKRLTKRKRIIFDLIEQREGQATFLLSELRALCHRQEVNPRTKKNCVISEAYTKSFNRTIRSMKSEIGLFHLNDRFDTCFAGLAAKALVAQLMHRGLFLKLPIKNGVEIRLFYEVYIVSLTHDQWDSYEGDTDSKAEYWWEAVDQEADPLKVHWWLSGLITTSNGRFAGLASLPIRPAIVAVSLRRPTSPILRDISSLPWDIYFLDTHGFKSVNPVSLLKNTSLEFSRFVDSLEFNGVQIDRAKQAYKRKIVLPYSEKCLPFEQIRLDEGNGVSWKF